MNNYKYRLNCIKKKKGKRFQAVLTVPYKRAMLLGGLHDLLTSFILTRDTLGTPVLWKFPIATSSCYILDADNSITFCSHHLSNTLIHKICCCSRNQASQSVSMSCYYVFWIPTFGNWIKWGPLKARVGVQPGLLRRHFWRKKSSTPSYPIIVLLPTVPLLEALYMVSFP